jgi:hypothetical protein
MGTNFPEYDLAYPWNSIIKGHRANNSRNLSSKNIRLTSVGSSGAEPKEIQRMKAAPNAIAAAKSARSHQNGITVGVNSQQETADGVDTIKADQPNSICNLQKKNGCAGK